MNAEENHQTFLRNSGEILRMGLHSEIILKNLYIQNYRNLKEASITDFKNLNIFIGPNNCGKTNREFHTNKFI